MTARIAVCHPYLYRGGSESRALRLVEALCAAHDVTLLTLGPVDLRQLNAYYGTHLADGDFTIARPRFGAWLGRRRRGLAVRGALLQRFAASVAADHDLMISAYNPLDFGRAAIQFVADLSWVPGVRHALHGSAFGQTAHSGLRRRAYDAIVRRLAGGEGAAAPRADDVVVANSHFVAGILEDALHVPCAAVVPPPVDGPLTAWAGAADRPAGFVSLGRVAPEKRIEEQIAIVRAVRSRGHDVTLTLFGGPTDGPYAERIRALVDAAGAWLTWPGWTQGEAKWRALASSRFGLHTTQGEAFGIAVAEMVRAGCLPFVPAAGGPAEIVAAPELCFEDHDDAVRKISAVVENHALEARLAAACHERGRLYTPQAFQRRAVRLVDEQLAARGAAVARG